MPESCRTDENSFFQNYHGLFGTARLPVESSNIECSEAFMRIFQVYYPFCLWVSNCFYKVMPKWRRIFFALPTFLAIKIRSIFSSFVFQGISVLARFVLVTSAACSERACRHQQRSFGYGLHRTGYAEADGAVRGAQR